MRWKVVVLVVLVFSVTHSSLAQEAPPVTFSFQPPGARSLGMGAAFLGLADDATAAEANPAGLILLSQMEASVHYRDSTAEQYFSSVFSERGESFVSESSADDVSFLSFVKPFEKWAISAYFAQNANIEGSGSGVIGDNDPVLQNQQDLQLEALGLSIAYRFSDQFAAGLTLRSSQLSVDLSQTATFLNSEGEFVRSDEVNVSGDDEDFTFILGVLINPGGKISLGLVYEDGGSYAVEQVIRTQIQEFPPQSLTFQVPDVLGLGLAWRATERVVVLLDAKEINYSNLNPLFEALITDPSLDLAEPLGRESELNLGIEYLISVNWGAIFLRGGAFRDPDHDGFKDRDTSEVIPTIGLGVSGRGGWQLDLGASFGDKSEDMIASFIYRF